MRAIMDTAMRGRRDGHDHGAHLSAGSYATTDELVEMAKVAAQYGGIYASHIRGEGQGGASQSVREAIAIGERAGLPVEIFHLKVAHSPAGASLMDSVRRGDRSGARARRRCRRRHVRRTRRAARDSRRRFRAGRTRAAAIRCGRGCANPEMRARLKREIETGSPGWWNIIEAAGGWDGVVLVNARNPENAKYERQDALRRSRGRWGRIRPTRRWISSRRGAAA